MTGNLSPELEVVSRYIPYPFVLEKNIKSRCVVKKSNADRMRGDGQRISRIKHHDDLRPSRQPACHKGLRLGLFKGFVIRPLQVVETVFSAETGIVW
jgi:hypothetical protein